jgi:hypothetical protein
MSPRPPPWWRLPLTQWRQEAAKALIDSWSRNPNCSFVALGHALVTLEALGTHQTVEFLMREHFGEHGPRLRPAKTRRACQQVAPRNRLLLHPLLAAVVIDADLRPQRDGFTAGERQQRAVIDALSAKQQQRLCAAGYLLLVTALAFAAVGQEQQRAKAVAIELLHASAWLYGDPLIKPTISLVYASAGIRFSNSSMRGFARREGLAD